MSNKTINSIQNTLSYLKEDTDSMLSKAQKVGDKMLVGKVEAIKKAADEADEYIKSRTEGDKQS